MLINLFCMMLATGVPLNDGLKLSALSVVVTAGGAALYAWAMRQDHISWAEAIGAGFATGTAVPALTTFLIGELGYRSAVTTWIWFAVLAIAAAAAFVRGPLRVQVGSASPAALAIVPLITVFGYHAWSPLMWPYLIGVVVVLGIGWIFHGTKFRSIVRLRHVPLTLLAIAPVIGLVLQTAAQNRFDFRRPYLYLGWLTDNIFDEGLTWSVSRYGYSENPFFQGQRVIGYLLTNSWTGDVNEALHVSPFTVLSSFGVLAALTSTLLITFAICEKHGLSSRVAVIAVILVGLQGSFGELFPFTEPPRIQHVLAMAWLLLAILSIEHFMNHTKWLTALFISLATVAVLLGKTQMFVVLIGFFAVSTLVASVDQRRMKPVFIGAMTTGVLMVVFRWASDRYFAARTNPWIFHRDTDTVLLWVMPIIIALVTRTFFPFTLFGRLGKSGNRFALRVAAVGLPAVVAFAVFHDANALRHMVEMTLLLGALSAAPLIHKFVSSSPRFVTILAIGSGFVFGALLFAQSERSIILNFPEESRVRLLALEHPARTQIAFILLASVLIVPVALLTRALSRNKRGVSIGLATCSVVGLLTIGTNFGTLVSWSVRLEVRGLVALEKGDPWPSRGERTEPHIPALMWVRAETDKSAIIANNLLCKGLPINGLVPAGNTPPDCALRNMSALVTAFGQRRSYMDGPSQAFIGAELMENASERYRDSILFATNNDPNSHERMIRDGVDYFVVDLGQTTLRDWEPRATIRYQDDHYAVVELNN